MVRSKGNIPVKKGNGKCYNITAYMYDFYNENDERIIRMMDKMLLSEQKVCESCVNFHRQYDWLHSCKIHGDLEDYEHPHHDLDGSNCPDYKFNPEAVEELDNIYESAKERRKMLSWIKD